MPLTISVQFNLITFSLIAGIITGVMFDIYCIARGLCKIKFIIIIEDILFWICAAMIVFTFLLYVNYAFLTLYVYVLISISVIFYLKFISRHFYNVEVKICSFIATCLRIILKTIRYFAKTLLCKLLDKNN